MPQSITFNPNNESAIISWALRYPYLEWTPGSKTLPKLNYRVVAQITGDTALHACTVLGVLGFGSFGAVFLAENALLGKLAIKIPRQRVIDPTNHGQIDGLREESEEQGIEKAANDLCSISSSSSTEEFLEKRRVRRQFLDKLLVETFNQGCAKRFERECSILQRISHPNVVKVHHVGEIGEYTQDDPKNAPVWVPLTPCIVMEYLAARKVQEVINGSDAALLERELPRLLKIGRDIALGTAAIHDHGSPHRDLSWNNVVVMDATDQAVVVDLGNVMDHNLVRDTGPGGSIGGDITIGTDYFVAPEQRELSLPEHASDQFSLGVMLYYWCTRDFPYTPAFHPKRLFEYVANGPGNDPKAITECLKAFIDSCSVRSQSAIEELSNAIMTSLSRNHVERHESMRSFAACLESILIDLGASKFDSPAEDELALTGRSLEAALAVGIRNAAGQQAVAGALILQSLVQHCRMEINRSVERLVGAIHEALTDDTPTPEERRRETGLRAYQCAQALITILRSMMQLLEPPKGSKPHTAFGRELRLRIEETVQTASGLLSSALKIAGNRALSLIEDARPVDPDSAPIRALDFDKFLVSVRKLTADLGEHDFRIAVYNRRIRKLAKEIYARSKASK